MNHVAYLIPTIDRIGGAERQVALLARGMSARGWRVTVIALSGNGGATATELSRHGVNFVTLEMRKGLTDPRGWLRLRSWIQRERPDILHGHLPHASWMARWIRLFARTPVVIDTIHTSSIGSIGRVLGYRLSRWLPDGVTAVSQDVADAYGRAKMVSVERLEVIPNGIPVNVINSEPNVRIQLRTQIGLADEFLWLAVGRLDNVKDYPTLLQAFANLHPSTHLAIAGAGSCETALLELANSLGLQSRVHFLGFVTNVPDWLQAADGFVQSSQWEGLPMALLEAFACALPVVATDVPGTRELVQHEKNGLLVPPHSPRALSMAMSLVVEMQRSDRIAMGLRARSVVIDRFSLDRVLAKWEALYIHHLSNARGSPDSNCSTAKCHRSDQCL